MATGTIKFYNEEKGFGFISRDDAPEDIFVHIKNCAEGIDALPKGARVRFDERLDAKRGKFEAIAVALL
jgi:CspA family cold shock protein